MRNSHIYGVSLNLALGTSQTRLSTESPADKLELDFVYIRAKRSDAPSGLPALPTCRPSRNLAWVVTRVVTAFFVGMQPMPAGSAAATRERYIPLPTLEDGYRRVLLLGTTGAGKTTVVRQLLGSHPVTDRFPSTSTAKTTIADTELITT